MNLGDAVEVLNNHKHLDYPWKTSALGDGTWVAQAGANMLTAFEAVAIAEKYERRAENAEAVRDTAFEVERDLGNALNAWAARYKEMLSAFWEAERRSLLVDDLARPYCSLCHHLKISTNKEQHYKGCPFALLAALGAAGEEQEP